MPGQIYGTWRDGAAIFKNRTGYFIYKWNMKQQKEYKKYLKTWKPKPSPTRLVLDPKKKKWVVVRKKKKAKKAKK